ncbi:GPX4 [Mytilus coruscus]|uniref:Glutathione peroxidase n=1 Tax=Mytilus coruscus TaxID=42192 RepID=A0A6J8E247_MYTCO|nr:GPX4 [Mytilus coruscus]
MTFHISKILSLPGPKGGLSRLLSSMAAEKDWWKKASSIYEFSAKDIDGNEVSLEKYKGHVLQALHAKYAESKGLRILGFPCNQFGSQEPGTEAEIKSFVTDKFGVQFDMFSKINVNGNDGHPLFKYLKHKQGGTLGDFIKWNFTKFLVNKEGIPVKRYAPNTEPNSIEKDFEKYW